MVKNKFKSSALSMAAGIILAAAPGAALAIEHGNSNAGVKVTICHATGSPSNPFVMISPNVNGIVSGHINHQDSRDIIPPFSYNDHGTTNSFGGRNWDPAGMAILHNGCKSVTEGGQGGGQRDCDNDFDNSPASECPVATTGGQGGGTTTTTTQGQVLAGSTAAVSGGQGAGPQVATVPQGSVNGGEGAAARAFSHSSLVGLAGSMLSLGSGLALLNRRQS